MLLLDPVAPPPAALQCTLHVADWFGPSRIVTEELAAWAETHGVVLRTADTMADGRGIGMLTTPGTLRCGEGAKGREVQVYLAPFPELGRRLGVHAEAPTGAPGPRAAGGLPDRVPPAERWSRAVLYDDASGVRRAWPSMGTADRIAAVTVAAAAGANAALAALLGGDAQLARTADAPPAGNTPLHYAALAGNLLGAKLLVAAGADPVKRNPVGTVPAHDAARAASPSVLALLGSQGALLGVNAYGDTVLHRLALYGGERPAPALKACWQCINQHVQTKLNRDAWVAFVDHVNVDGFTALDLAVAMGEDGLAALLRGAGGRHGARWRTRGEGGFRAEEVVHRPRT